MLVLQRKEEEGILIGDNVRVIVAEIKRGVVKIGIEAPDDVLILREELLEVADSNKEASHYNDRTLKAIENIVKTKK